MRAAPAALAGLVLAHAATAVGHAEATCPVSRPVVAVELRIPDPAIDNSLPQPKLQGLAGLEGHGDRALGLYRTTIRSLTRTIMDIRKEGGGICHWIERVVVEVAMTERKIYVVRDRHPGTCLYDVVIEHERRHQAIDDELLSERAPALRLAVAETIAAMSPRRPVPEREARAVQAQLNDEILAAVKQAMAEIEILHKARQAEIDTSAEYERIGKLCR